MEEKARRASGAATKPDPEALRFALSQLWDRQRELRDRTLALASVALFFAGVFGAGAGGIGLSGRDHLGIGLGLASLFVGAFLIKRLLPLLLWLPHCPFEEWLIVDVELLEQEQETYKTKRDALNGLMKWLIALAVVTAAFASEALNH